jgi:hypothetical protein
MPAILRQPCGRGATGWAYTTGLSDGWDHPELVVGLPDRPVARMLATLGDQVTNGETR